MNIKHMRVFLLLIVSSFIVKGVNAQPTPTFFSASAGPSIGANNYAGSMGLELEYLFVKHLSVNAGIGYGPWGLVTGGQVRFYMNYPYKFYAFSGFTSALGSNGVERSVQNTDTTLTKISVDLKPASSVDVGVGYALQVGMTGRLHFRIGYSFGITDKLIGFKEPLVFTLREADTDKIKAPAPGGIIFTLAYTFGFGNN